MANKNRKECWTVSVAKHQDSSYGHIEMTFRRSVLKCASNEIAAEAAAGNTTLDYWIKRCQEVRETTGQTLYYDPLYKQDLTIAWQCNRGTNLADNESQEWYGMRLHGGELSEVVGKAIVKMAQLPYDAKPQDAINLLKAKPVKYQTYWCWVPAELDLVCP